MKQKMKISERNKQNPTKRIRRIRSEEFCLLQPERAFFEQIIILGVAF